MVTKIRKKGGEVQSSNTQYGPLINILRNVGNKLWYTFSVTGTMWQIYYILCMITEYVPDVETKQITICIILCTSKYGRCDIKYLNI